VLTKREAEIASLIALGLTSKQIGDRLGTSKFTVQRQAQDIYLKLGVDSWNELAIKLNNPNSDAPAQIIGELRQKVEDLAAERNGYRSENRELRERLRRYEASH